MANGQGNMMRQPQAGDALSLEHGLGESTHYNQFSGGERGGYHFFSGDHHYQSLRDQHTQTALQDALLL